MPQNDAHSLWDALSGAPLRAERCIWGTESRVTLSELHAGSTLGGRLAELRGRSVLVVTRDQLSAALALVQIDGIARRLVLCPPDLDMAHIPFVMATAEVDAVVSDQSPADLGAANAGYFHSVLFRGYACAACTRRAAVNRVGFIHLRHERCAEDGLAHFIEPRRRHQRRRRVGGRNRLEHVLRHSPLWWPANLSCERCWAEDRWCCRVAKNQQPTSSRALDHSR